jgi:hypothetical protein
MVGVALLLLPCVLQVDPFFEDNPNPMLGPGDCFAEVAYFTEVPSERHKILSVICNQTRDESVLRHVVCIQMNECAYVTALLVAIAMQVM